MKIATSLNLLLLFLFKRFISRLTTFSSNQLPITLIDQEHADQMYSELIGTSLLRVPCGGQERLKVWPRLAGREISFNGISWKQSAIDVVLSSAG
jgi:nitric oxide-associated protein 1